MEEGGGGHPPPADPSQLRCQRQARKLLRCLPNPNHSSSFSFTSQSLLFTGLVQARNGKRGGLRVALRVALNPLPLKPSELSIERPLSSGLQPQTHAGLECQRCSILVSPREVVDSATELQCLRSVLHSPTDLDSSSRARLARSRTYPSTYPLLT